MGERRSAAPAQGPESVAAGSGDASSAFAKRLATIANAEYEALCQTIMAKALDGERWAVELVVRYVFARDAEGEDGRRTLLEAVRERAARGA